MSGDYEQTKLRVCQSEGAYATMRPLASSWEQRKLGELCIISKGHGYSKADIRDAGTPLILYGRLYTQYESRIENVDTFAVEQEGSLLSKGNEVIVPASGETAEDIAVASSVRRSGIIFGGDLNVVTPVSKLDPDYIALAITYSKAHDDLAKRAQGKSVCMSMATTSPKLRSLTHRKASRSAYLRSFSVSTALSPFISVSRPT